MQVAQLSLEDAGQGGITLKTYYKYFLLGSGYVLFATMCALFLVSQVSNGQCSSEIFCVNTLYLIDSFITMCICGNDFAHSMQANIVVADWWLSEW